MSNQLIKNETDVFYTVNVNDDTYVHGVEFYHGRVEKLDLRPVGSYAGDPWETGDKNRAWKAAVSVGGKIIKHTRTEVVTEITERIHVIKEETNND